MSKAFHFGVIAALIAAYVFVIGPTDFADEVERTCKAREAK